jgi:hypothetical protein
MKARLVLQLLAGLVVAALLLALALPAFSQTGIQVNNADTTRTTSTSLASDLNIALGGVGSRIVTQYANTMRYIRVGIPPAPFQSLLNQVMLRTILLDANTARQQQMIYPRGLIGDTSAPVISARSAAPAAGGIKVTWTTDELADSTVVYGTQPGVYPQTRSDPLYVRSHVILLTGLTPGTYYYRVQSRDQSGNPAQSAEGSFTVTAMIPRAYLPLLLR